MDVSSNARAALLAAACARRPRQALHVALLMVTLWHAAERRHAKALSARSAAAALSAAAATATANATAAAAAQRKQAPPPAPSTTQGLSAGALFSDLNVDDDYIIIIVGSDSEEEKKAAGGGGAGAAGAREKEQEKEKEEEKEEAKEEPRPPSFRDPAHAAPRLALLNELCLLPRERGGAPSGFPVSLDRAPPASRPLPHWPLVACPAASGDGGEDGDEYGGGGRALSMRHQPLLPSSFFPDAVAEARKAVDIASRSLPEADAVAEAAAAAASAAEEAAAVAAARRASGGPSVFPRGGDYGDADGLGGGDGFRPSAAPAARHRQLALQQQQQLKQMQLQRERQRQQQLQQLQRKKRNGGGSGGVGGSGDGGSGQPPASLAQLRLSERTAPVPLQLEDESDDGCQIPPELGAWQRSKWGCVVGTRRTKKKLEKRKKRKKPEEASGSGGGGIGNGAPAGLKGINAASATIAVWPALPYRLRAPSSARAG